MPDGIRDPRRFGLLPSRELKDESCGNLDTAALRSVCDCARMVGEMLAATRARNPGWRIVMSFGGV